MMQSRNRRPIPTKSSGDPVAIDDWLEYIKGGKQLADAAEDVFGNDYGDQTVDSLPNVPARTWDALSESVDANFWSPCAREATPGDSSRAAAPSAPKQKLKKRRHCS
jgi:hypothetical protein